MEKRYNESFQDYAQRWRTMAVQVQPPLVETEIAILFLGTLQEPYYDRLMYAATRSFANMIKVGNVIDHAIKNGKIDLGEVVLNQKGIVFQRRKKAKPKPCTNKTHPINPGDTLHTRTTRITSHTTQLRVIKLLLWLHIIHPPTKHKPYKHANQFQIANQTPQGIITL